MPKQINESIIKLIIDLYTKNNSIRNISNKINIDTKTIKKYLIKHNIEIKNNKNKNDYIKGKKFNKITVIEKTNNLSYDKCFEWSCKCDCGNKIYLSLHKIKHGCGMCENCRYKNTANILTTGINELSGKYFSRLIHGAKLRNLEFSISKEYIYDLFIKQNKKCKYTNLEIDLGGLPGERKLQTASLDRIDSSKGYIEGNVQWIHKDINLMKMDFSNKQFIEYCKLVTQNA